MKRGKKWVAGRGSGPAQGLPRGSPRGAHQNEPKCFKNQGFSCFWEHFRLLIRPPSWLQILAPSPVIRKSIFFPRWPEINLNEPKCCLNQCYSYDFDDFGTLLRPPAGRPAGWPGFNQSIPRKAVSVFPPGNMDFI